MIKFLIRKTIKNHADVLSPEVRTSYGKLAGVLGMICNFVLFLLKLFAGIAANSVAVLSDAFNNLSDMASSLVSFIGITAANRHADEEHPFGHGRFEYIASLIVSFLIILVGFELLRSSFEKILSGETATFKLVSLIILLASIFVKLWMFLSNRYIGKTIDSMVISAAGQDALNDVFSTLAVIFSMLLGLFISAPLDGIMGLFISVFIMYSGYKIARDTITVLLGSPPDPAVTKEICDIILAEEQIFGVHDLIVHDYGPGRCMASIHAEVPVDADIVKIHEVIDEIEKRIQTDLGIHIVIHMDPISVNNERISALRDFVLSCVKQVNTEFGLHDFRMTDGETNINLIFDLEVPCRLKASERELAVSEIKRLLKEKDARFNAVISIDNKF